MKQKKYCAYKTFGPLFTFDIYLSVHYDTIIFTLKNCMNAFSNNAE